MWSRQRVGFDWLSPLSSRLYGAQNLRLAAASTLDCCSALSSAQRACDFLLSSLRRFGPAKDGGV
jgi:hypothetical protein